MVNLSSNNSNNVNLSGQTQRNVNISTPNTNNVDANTMGNSQRARSWAIGEGLIDGEDYSAKHYALLSQEIEQQIASDTNYAHIWAEGTDEEVEALGGEHSSKGWVNYVLTNPPTANIEQTESGATITVHDINGTTTADITNGTDGQDGTDGVSPTASVTQTATGATITITDENGTTTADITNGVNGIDGTSAEITGATASITDTVGTPAVSVTMGGTSQARTFNFAFSNLKGEQGIQGVQGVPGQDGQDGQDGADGADGQDGFSPTATVTQSGDVTTISITDKNGTTTKSIDLSDYQALLVSGTNIKTINNQSILGSGNITIQGGGGGAVDSVNGYTGTVVLTASDVGAVDLTSAQDISGRKTFLGEKAIYFKQSATTNKLGFTLYNPSNTELAAFEYRPNTISGNALLNVNTSYSNACYVGFRYWGTAVNIIAPKVATAGDYYIPTHITNGTTTVTAGSTGSVNISSLLPTVDQTYDGTSSNAQSGVAIAGELNSYVLSSALATVATTGAYSDLTGTPTFTYDSTNERIIF